MTEHYISVLATIIAEQRMEIDNLRHDAKTAREKYSEAHTQQCALIDGYRKDISELKTKLHTRESFYEEADRELHHLKARIRDLETAV